MKFRRFAMVAAGVLAAAATAAQANTIQINYVSQVGTAYTYDVKLTSDSYLLGDSAPNRVVLIDFPDLASANFTASALFAASGFSTSLVTEMNTSAALWNPPLVPNPPFGMNNPPDGGATNVRLEFANASTAAFSGGALGVSLGTLVINTNVLTSPVSESRLTISIDYKGTAASTIQRSDSTTLTPVVPVPAAAWSGMALLGLLGGSQYLRRRAMVR